MVSLVRLLLDDKLDVPELGFELELTLELLPELAKVEVPLLLHTLHHQLHLKDLQAFEIRHLDHECNIERYLGGEVFNLCDELLGESTLWSGGSWASPSPLTNP